MKYFVLTLGFIIVLTANAISLEYKHDLGFGVSPTEPIPGAAYIKGIQFVSNDLGVAYTSRAIFVTEDDGRTWQEIEPAEGPFEMISGVHFTRRDSAAFILYDMSIPGLTLAKTEDGGRSLTRTPIDLNEIDRLEADLDNADISSTDPEHLTLTLRLQTSSNFKGKTIYHSDDGGRTWEFDRRVVSISGNEAGFNLHRGPWTLSAEGTCEKFKLDCVLGSKIVNDRDGRDITPAQIKDLTQIEKDKGSGSGIFAEQSALGGATRVSTSRGFDKCTAASAAQMRIWWYTSPFDDSNIYISGRNRGCSQPQLSAAWVDRVSAMGWGLIPTVVGYQSPCSSCASCQKHSSDPATAETQGRGEADIAIADAGALGLAAGTVLYYDMERYDDTSGTGACSTPTKAFLKGWTDRLKEMGYVSGAYGSPFNANGDWINIAPESQMDVVWLARWNTKMSVWDVSPLPNTFWPNDQRIHQWLGPRDETWGGVTFNIDNNISAAPVAGVVFVKN